MNYETIDLSKDFSHRVMNFSPRFEDFEGARRKMPILGAPRIIIIIWFGYNVSSLKK